jgi:hypothetical protein
MMKIPTVDPDIFIIAKEPERVVYHSEFYDETWEITGTCNQCGECEAGAVNDHYLVWTGIAVGQSGACYNKFGGPDQRLDVPMAHWAPSALEHCVLKGKMLSGN